LTLDLWGTACFDHKHGTGIDVLNPWLGQVEGGILYSNTRVLWSFSSRMGSSLAAVRGRSGFVKVLIVLYTVSRIDLSNDLIVDGGWQNVDRENRFAGFK
jgi:hypothetical protein